MELKFVKRFDNLVALCPLSIEALCNIKHGDIVNVKISKARNSKFHKKFFVMLRVAFEYYEPDNTTLSADYRQALKDLADWLQPKMTGVNVEQDIMKVFWLQQNRKLDTVSHNKSFEAFRRFVLIEAGFYNLLPTPTGTVKIAQSISFANMSQVEFAEVYKACSGVCWRLVLSGKMSKEEFEERVNILLEF